MRAIPLTYPISLVAMPVPASGKIGLEAAERLAAVLRWYSQDAIVFPAGGKTVAIDPFELGASPGLADLVLVTHEHDDHYSPKDIERIAAKGAVRIAPFAAPGFRRIAIGERIDLGFCAVTALRAYNAVKTRFHPKEKGWAGYLVEADGLRLYITGDTERIPEMKAVRADLMLVPLGQTYTMGSVEEAVLAVKDVKPLLAIPIHWGRFEGTRADAERFVSLLEGSGIKALLKTPAR